jgi:hypothetical protein
LLIQTLNSQDLAKSLICNDFIERLISIRRSSMARLGAVLLAPSLAMLDQ